MDITMETPELQIHTRRKELPYFGEADEYYHEGGLLAAYLRDI